MSKAKHKAQDPKEVALKDKSEVGYFKTAYNISAPRVREAAAATADDGKKVGKGRKRLMAYLIQQGDIKVDGNGKPIKRAK